MTDTSRQAFEKMCRKRKWRTERCPHIQENYKNPYVQEGFEIWLASEQRLLALLESEVLPSLERCQWSQEKQDRLVNGTSEDWLIEWRGVLGNVNTAIQAIKAKVRKHD